MNGARNATELLIVGLDGLKGGAVADPGRMIYPHQYEVLFWLAVDKAHSATARELFESHYQHRPSYQQWDGRKVGNVLRSLRRLGLVDLDPGTRVWTTTLKGSALIGGESFDDALARLCP